MATDNIERMHYYQRQYLGALDFEDQQTYHREMRRRLNLAHHSWGIVVGLELHPTNTTAGQPTDIYINPGMAIDGYGREIVIFQRQQLDPTDFRFFHDINYHTVCLQYNEVLTQSPQAGYGQCDRSNQSNQFGRVGETYLVLVQDAFRDDISINGQAASLASTSYPLIQDPEDVPILPQPSSSPPNTNGPSIPLDESVPYQEFRSDDPIITQWLIPLGQVRWDGTTRQFIGDDKHNVILGDGRHYIGAIASRIFAPAGKLIVRDRN